MSVFGLRETRSGPSLHPYLGLWLTTFPLAFPYNRHSFLPNPASSWTVLSHPEDGGGTFLRTSEHSPTTRLRNKRKLSNSESKAVSRTHTHRHYNDLKIILGGTRWRSWLRHCATSRKVASSVSVGVFGIFHLLNPSGRTMALGSTQPLTEMSTRGISWAVKAVGE
jgi:hypothetical protein